VDHGSGEVAEMAAKGGEEFARFLVEHDSYFVDEDRGPARS
jgi:hypothetical protein